AQMKHSNVRVNSPLEGRRILDVHDVDAPARLRRIRADRKLQRVIAAVYRLLEQLRTRARREYAGLRNERAGALQIERWRPAARAGSRRRSTAGAHARATANAHTRAASHIRSASGPEAGGPKAGTPTWIGIVVDECEAADAIEALAVDWHAADQVIHLVIAGHDSSAFIYPRRARELRSPHAARQQQHAQTPNFSHDDSPSA